MNILDLILLKAAQKGGGGGYVQATATGNPLTFNTDVAKPLKSLLIPWTPSQSGSGDPSPENVRPISGVSGLTVWRTGENMFNPAIIENGDITSGGVYSGGNTTRLINKTFLTLAPGKYTISNKLGFPCAIYAYSEADESTFIASESKTSWNNSPATFTLSNARCVRFKWKNNDSPISPSDLEELMLNIGETASEYTPYVGTTIPVTFPGEVGTVYGGSLDLTTGVMTVGRACITETGTSEMWSVGITSGYQRVIINKNYLPNAPKNNSTENLLVNYMKSASTPAEWNAFIGSTGNVIAYVNATTFPDKTAWLAYLAEHPLEICYELAEPYTVQLTPQQITALVGDNVIWTDTNGSNTAVYLKRG